MTVITAGLKVSLLLVPSIIDTPLLTNDVELRGSDFATTPADVDTLKEIVWSINGTEYSAGVTNPWSPLEKLPINSTVTVKVKYKGNVARGL